MAASFESVPSPPASVEPQGISRVRKGVILFGSMCNMFLLTTTYGLSTLYVAILDEFGTTRKESSLIQSTNVGLTLGSGILIGILVRIFGLRLILLVGGVIGFTGLLLGYFATSVPYLIATVGVLAGVGNSCIYVSVNTLVVTTFERRRGLAASALMVAAGTGMILFPVVAEQLMKEYNWRGCLLLLSALYLHITVISLLSTSPFGAGLQLIPNEINIANCSDVKDSRWRHFLSPMFFLYAVASSLSVSITTSVTVSFVDYMRSEYVSLEAAVKVFVGFNAANLACRLLAGSLNQIPRSHSLVIFCLAALVSGVALIFLSVVSRFSGVVVLLCLVGSGYGGMTSMVNVVPVDLTGTENASLSIGIASTLRGVTIPAMAALTGWLYDTTQSYDMAFRVCGGITTGASGLTLLVFTVSRLRNLRHGKKKGENSSQ